MPSALGQVLKRGVSQRLDSPHLLRIHMRTSARTAHPHQKDFSMSSKIYVGNLPYSVTDHHLRSNFAEFGDVSSAKIMMDRDTGRSKGFGFVEMSSAAFAQAAIAALHGMSVEGRAIVVTMARPREDRQQSGGYSSTGYTATKRSDVGYGSGGYGGGRY